MANLTEHRTAVYTTTLDLDSALSTPALCPGCGRRHLIARTAHDRTVFHCASCGRNWYVGLGRASELTLLPTSL